MSAGKARLYAWAIELPIGSQKDRIVRAIGCIRVPATQARKS